MLGILVFGKMDVHGSLEEQKNFKQHGVGFYFGCNLKISFTFCTLA